MDCKECEIDYKKSTLEKAVKKYGKAQVNLCMEECAELIQALSKWYRGIPNNDNIAEEIADVKIMLEQMQIFFDNEVEVERWEGFKLYRLEGMLEDDRELYNTWNSSESE